jgi:hypothetical protein
LHCYGVLFVVRNNRCFAVFTVNKRFRDDVAESFLVIAVMANESLPSASLLS